MYTTNIVQGIHRQFRRVIKTKSILPIDLSLEKMLYLTSQMLQKCGLRGIKYDRNSHTKELK